MPTVALGAKFVQLRSVATWSVRGALRGAGSLVSSCSWCPLRAVRVMRTAVLGPGTANDTGEMKPPKMIKQTAAATTSDHAQHSCQTMLLSIEN